MDSIMHTRHFNSLGEFARFTSGLGLQKLAADVQGRSVVAHHLTKEVRDVIGDREKLKPYLADSTVIERLEKGFSADETLLRTGELQRSIGWEHVSVLTTVVASSDPKAVFHEFGTPRTPRRSFLASTAAEHNTTLFAMYVAAFGLRFVTGKNTTNAMTHADSLVP
jgi:hypothetical protein